MRFAATPAGGRQRQWPSPLLQLAMKSSVSRAKQGPPMQQPAAAPLLVQADSGQQTFRRGPRIDDRSLSSNLPDLLPVLPEECDLMRIYFADLIADVLKAN